MSRHNAAVALSLYLSSSAVTVTVIGQLFQRCFSSLYELHIYIHTPHTYRIAICHFVLWPTLSAELVSRVIQNEEGSKGLCWLLLLLCSIFVCLCECVYCAPLSYVRYNKQTNKLGKGIKKANWLLHCSVFLYIFLFLLFFFWKNVLLYNTFAIWDHKNWCP